jgi:hypothetical protein
MDAAMIPGAMPPKLKRKRRHPDELPPEEYLPEEMTDYGLPNEGAMNVAYGGYGEMAPGVEPLPAEPRNPLAGPMFRRYRQTANAPMPGTPGGLGGPPLEDGNPMDEAFPNPFETPEPVRSVTVPGGASVTGGSPQAASTPASQYTQADDPNKKKQTYGGRYGRRQTSRTNSRTMPPRRR